MKKRHRPYRKHFPYQLKKLNILKNFSNSLEVHPTDTMKRLIERRKEKNIDDTELFKGTTLENTNN